MLYRRETDFDKDKGIYTGLIRCYEGIGKRNEPERLLKRFRGVLLLLIFLYIVF